MSRKSSTVEMISAVILMLWLFTSIYHLISHTSSVTMLVTRLMYEDRPIGVLTYEADCTRILADIRNDRRHRYVCRTGRP